MRPGIDEPCYQETSIFDQSRCHGFWPTLHPCPRGPSVPGSLEPINRKVTRGHWNLDALINRNQKNHGNSGTLARWCQGRSGSLTTGEPRRASDRGTKAIERPRDQGIMIGNRPWLPRCSSDRVTKFEPAPRRLGWLGNRGIKAANPP